MPRVARSLSDRCRHDRLRCADGLIQQGGGLGVHEHTVGKWRRRFLKERIEGCRMSPLGREGGRGPASSGRWRRRRPTRPTGSVRWPGRAGTSHDDDGAFACSRTARRPSSSPATAVRETRSASRRRHRALVLCVDEKESAGPHRTQRSLPSLGSERRTHDYKRHGTILAVRVATGRVIGKCYRRHRPGSSLDFLKEIDRSVTSTSSSTIRHPQAAASKPGDGTPLASADVGVVAAGRRRRN